jgi:hypothetical protein
MLSQEFALPNDAALLVLNVLLRQRLLSCKATDHSHSLIEGGDLSLRNLPSPPLTRLREGTDKSFLKWG